MRQTFREYLERGLKILNQDAKVVVRVNINDATLQVSVCALPAYLKGCGFPTFGFRTIARVKLSSLLHVPGFELEYGSSVANRHGQWH